MWFLVLMISPTPMLVDADRAGLYGPFYTYQACVEAGKRFANSGVTPNGTYVDKTFSTASTCTELARRTVGVE
jgi:hypothetical protein